MRKLKYSFHFNRIRLQPAIARQEAVPQRRVALRKFMMAKSSETFTGDIIRIFPDLQGVSEIECSL